MNPQNLFFSQQQHHQQQRQTVQGGPPPGAGLGIARQNTPQGFGAQPQQFNFGNMQAGCCGALPSCGPPSAPSSNYNPSGDLLAMMKQGQGLGLQQNKLQGMGMSPGLGHLPHGLGHGMGLNMGGAPELPTPVGTTGFDLSDFPSLGQRPAAGSGLQQFRAQPHPPPSEFAMQSEDFPALPGAATASSNASSTQQESGSDGLFRHSNIESSGLTPNPAGGGGLSRSAEDLNSSIRNQAGSRSDNYGLMGILSALRIPEPDPNTLALGTDLTSLGLNLNSSDCLYSTFASPWVDAPVQREPDFTLPQCYYMQPPALKTGHFSKFQLETLFYIFYNMPRDTLQAYAATELYNRDWRYHKDLTLWFTRAARQGTDDGQKGQYIYFDITEWRKKLFHGVGGGAGPVEGAEDNDEMNSLGE
mmetsp:Transcript_20681/g.63258  ORF Transcript_20681/g.63258 Transcript_20681/m.63258 type:complete len:416 (+) Transcript_20681:150-1397(+)|eukprot:scaffold183316_cov36-Tisochrysis_lutea.AAC.1